MFRAVAVCILFQLFSKVKRQMYFAQMGTWLKTNIIQKLRVSRFPTRQIQRL